MNPDQAEFTRALLDPERAVPQGLSDPQGRPAGKRFAVYRNNVAHSLTEALETAFPVVCKLVGEEFFRAMAGVYLRQHPPSSALMMFFGETLPAFLEGFEPVRHLAYLPDVARLETARRQSYHAADADPLDAAALLALPPDRLMAVRLRLAPALRLIRSPWPVHGIWLANMEPDAPPPAVAEDVLITRPAFDPEMSVLAPGGAAFVAALADGQSLSDAVDAATEIAPDFDPTPTLGLLVAGNALISTIEDAQP